MQVLLKKKEQLENTHQQQAFFSFLKVPSLLITLPLTPLRSQEHARQAKGPGCGAAAAGVKVLKQSALAPPQATTNLFPIHHIELEEPCDMLSITDTHARGMGIRNTSWGPSHRHLLMSSFSSAGCSGSLCRIEWGRKGKGGWKKLSNKRKLLCGQIHSLPPPAEWGLLHCWHPARRTAIHPCRSMEWVGWSSSSLLTSSSFKDAVFKKDSLSSSGMKAQNS